MYCQPCGGVALPTRKFPAGRRGRRRRRRRDDALHPDAARRAARPPSVHDFNMELRQGGASPSPSTAPSSASHHNTPYPRGGGGGGAHAAGSPSASCPALPSPATPFQSTQRPNRPPAVNDFDLRRPESPPPQYASPQTPGQRTNSRAYDPDPPRPPAPDASPGTPTPTSMPLRGGGGASASGSACETPPVFPSSPSTMLGPSKRAVLAGGGQPGAQLPSSQGSTPMAQSLAGSSGSATPHYRMRSTPLHGTLSPHHGALYSPPMPGAAGSPARRARSNTTSALQRPSSFQTRTRPPSVYDAERPPQTPSAASPAHTAGRPRPASVYDLARTADRQREERDVTVIRLSDPPKTRRKSAEDSCQGSSSNKHPPTKPVSPVSPRSPAVGAGPAAPPTDPASPDTDGNAQSFCSTLSTGSADGGLRGRLRLRRATAAAAATPCSSEDAAALLDEPSSATVREKIKKAELLSGNALFGEYRHEDLQEEASAFLESEEVPSVAGVCSPLAGAADDPLHGVTAPPTQRHTLASALMSPDLVLSADGLSAGKFAGYVAFDSAAPAPPSGGGGRVAQQSTSTLNLTQSSLQNSMGLRDAMYRGDDPMPISPPTPAVAGDVAAVPTGGVGGEVPRQLRFHESCGAESREPESPLAATWDRAAYEQHARANESPVSYTDGESPLAGTWGGSFASVGAYGHDVPNTPLRARARSRVRRESMCLSNCASLTKPMEKTGNFTWKRGRLLGQGAFGKVHLGLNDATGELMAVKNIDFSHFDKDITKKLEELRKEIQIMQPLDHAHVIKYFFTERVGTSVNIFMEYIPGGSLQALLNTFGPLSDRSVVQYTYQIVGGLSYLHDSGIVHRDIKGANILLTVEGHVKLADFGAAAFGAAAENFQFDAADAPQAGQGCRGTPLWMAPEVIKSERHDWEADIWSLGCTVMEMLTAKPPWAHLDMAKDAAGLQMAVLKYVVDEAEAIVLPDGLNLQVSGFLRDCLQRAPTARPAACELLDHDYFFDADGEERSPRWCQKGDPGLFPVPAPGGAAAGGGDPEAQPFQCSEVMHSTVDVEAFSLSRQPPAAATTG
eukprot:TRINITY_DN6808_c0_g2_i1.p1 TRINITY_DN6808_c0_g2~~TRINITY_DN6808_c0_g2_i1.p1  ORF type:complete len:1073 (+),score=345.77 TRINITY_DN6808_c0_g2_i1:545-3763(+)